MSRPKNNAELIAELRQVAERTKEPLVWTYDTAEDFFNLLTWAADALENKADISAAVDDVLQPFDRDARHPDIVPPAQREFQRDHFASAAMQALASGGIEWPDPRALAVKAYEIADAMMEARAK